jgi:hypothetical protein
LLTVIFNLTKLRQVTSASNGQTLATSRPLIAIVSGHLILAFASPMQGYFSKEK